MKHGRNLIVALDGVPIAGAKSCKFSIAQNFLKACSPTDGRAKNKIPTDYDWSVSCDCLIPNSNLPVSLKDKLIAGTKCLLTFTDGDGDNRAGFVYVKSCDEDGTIGNLAKFSASFESSGALYKYTTYAFASFTEGSGVDIVINGSTVSYSYNTLSDTDGVQMRPTKNGKLLVLFNGAWVVYQSQFSAIKTALSQQTMNSLSSSIVGYGVGGVTEISLTANTYYTLLADAQSTPNKAFFLYQ